MALLYVTGFDLAKVGTLSMTCNDGTFTFSLSMSTGTYCPIDLQTVMGTGKYDDFLTGFKTAFDAAAAGAGSAVTVTAASSNFNSSTAYGYHVVFSAAMTLSSLNTVAKNTLGVSTSTWGTTTTTFNSDIRPYYVINPGVGGRANVSDDYEDGDIAFDGEADDGNSYGITRTRACLYQDWVQPMEAKAAVYKRSASSSVPWTYQHMFEHVRNSEPILVQDADGGSGTDDMVCKLTSKGCIWKPERVTADYDGEWNVPFMTRIVQTSAGVSRI